MDKIEPALTPEEWGQRKYEFAMCGGLTVHDDGDGLEFVLWQGTKVFEKAKILYGGRGIDFQALAAMALFFGNLRRREGMPTFGFTREDLERLRTAVRFAEDALPDPRDLFPERLQNLAARIEALLPPEGE
jgi:hypothetical protein